MPLTLIQLLSGWLYRWNWSLNLYTQTGTTIPRGVRMFFFKRNPFRLTYFLPTAAKSKQKMPLDDNALHPIFRFLHNEFMYVSF
jgi:hypothetical protein